MLNEFLLEYMPHGHCYAWQPLILWMSVLSDIAIASAYFSIPVALVIIIRKRNDIKFKGVFLLFALFILCCGITHLVSVYTIWHGVYGLQAVSKLVTAVVSLATAIYVYARMSDFLQVPSIDEHRKALEQAAEERIKRHELEYEKKSAAIFKFTTQLVPTGLLVIDEHQQIRLANNAAESIFGYDSDELIGQPLSSLIVGHDADRHSILVDNFISQRSGSHQMAAGRVVSGVKKDGSEALVEIKIAVHEHEGAVYAFANITDVKREELEQGTIIENNYRIRRALEATHDGIWEWNLQTNEVWYSPRLLQLLGRDPSAIPELSLWEKHIHPDDKAMVTEVLTDHLENKARFDVVYRGDVGGGKYQWLHTRGDTIFDGSGTPKLMTGTLTNVHEIRELREELESKSLFLKEVLDRSLTGLYIFNLKEFKNTYINPEYTRICGYTLEDLDHIQNKEGSLMSLFHPDEQHLIEQHFNNVLSEKESDGVGIEYRFRHKDGHWVWCYSRDSIYRYDENGEPESMLGAFFDIGNIKDREAEINKLAIDFSSTFDQAAVGMAMVDLEGKFEKVNGKLCQILGYHESELTKLKFTDVTFADDVEKSLEYFRCCLNGELRQFETEKRYKRKDGSEIWVQLTVAMVVDSDGEDSHFVSVAEDITRRKIAEAELEKSNASLERFAYSASHDLQEPLRKISAFAELLEHRLDGKLPDQEAIFQLNRISDAAKRMGEMIRSLLDLSRYARKELVRSNHDFSELVTLALEDLSVKISRSNSRVIVEGDAILYVEKNSFQQVLRNLIANAIHYSASDEAPEIELRCETLEKEIQITVTDNGLGFDKEKAEQIFEPFRRLHSNKSSGTGMGLAICRQIVQSHQGQIFATPLTRGARFTIKLPKDVTQA